MDAFYGVGARGVWLLVFICVVSRQEHWKELEAQKLQDPHAALAFMREVEYGSGVKGRGNGGWRGKGS